jgi:hypothetical protein
MQNAHYNSNGKFIKIGQNEENGPKLTSSLTMMCCDMLFDFIYKFQIVFISAFISLYIIQHNIITYMQLQTTRKIKLCNI